MKRKNWSIFFIGMLAMCTIAGCSGNELNGSNEPEVYPGHPEDAVYMNVNIQLPVGGKNTRSSTDSDSDDDYGTSTDGTEVGKDYENKVNGVLIVLADANNNFIAAGEHNSLPVVREGIVNTTQKINKSALGGLLWKRDTWDRKRPSQSLCILQSDNGVEKNLRKVRCRQRMD